MRRWMGGALAVAALGAAVATIVSCRQIVGIQDNPLTTATTACGLPYATTTCASCIQAYCCSESSSCATSKACAQYESCFGPCDGGPQCLSQCTVDHPVGAGSSAEVSALSACVTSKCEKACGISCGAMAAYISPPSSASACQQCITTQSCTDAHSCGASPDCDAYMRCYLGCRSWDCQQACATRHPTGSADFTKVYAAYSHACATPCAYGSNWNCVGQVVWPAPEATTTTITLTVRDGPSPTTLVSGATVSFCPWSSGVESIQAACPSPLDRRQTDTSGLVSLQVPTVAPGSNTGAVGFLWITDADAGYLPTFAYAAVPLSESSVTLAQSAVLDTPAEVSTIVTSLDAGFDPGQGVLLVSVVDCLLSPAWGVAVSTDHGGAGPFYYLPGPSRMGTPGEQVTDRSGLARFCDVPGGPLVVTATALGTIAGQTAIYYQPGALNTAFVAPSP